ncbi:hypothetical protein ACFYON_24685 [Micromonospora sp. NPDC005686]|uniref:8-oxoguanine DNA glycosylase OGG fold protein n=1 Tax=unclassified Micromonospora TaxID=2617518 RepID=UPI0033A52E1B
MAFDPEELPHDLNAFDRGVIADGLSADEQSSLVGRRQAWASQCGGRYEDPDDLVDRHEVRIFPSHWSMFPDFPFASSAEYASRRAVTEVAWNCAKDDWIPLLVASLAWGWGTRGFGPTRLSWILHGCSRWEAPTQPETNRRLAAAIGDLEAGGAVAAYRRLHREEPIPGLGPAFFTKLLYFADRARADGARPLILDARLAAWMRSIWQARAGQPYAEGARSAAWLWRGPLWTPYRYEVYLTFMNRVADQLSETGERWSPDLVELLLFRPQQGAACDVGDPTQPAG